VSKKDLQGLPPHYRDWLTKEVNYIITEEEAQAFVRLATAAERDTFISRFWDIRNPDPGSPTNRYRDEIYERIAYANQYFGHESGTPGWMTEMGRVYITLGPPKQRAKYLSLSSVKPMEIWFFDNAHPALPPFFYVVFYQRDPSDNYRLYSPYMDGPEKLVTSHHAENGRLDAWTQIDKSAGREVSRTTLTLLPDEPIDINTAESSLQSDVMLSTIKGLANNPHNKEMLRQRRALLEDVTHRVILSDEFLDVLTVTLRDPAGSTNLHYLARLKRPEDFAIAEGSTGRYYTSAEIDVRVLSPDGHPIFTQHRDLSRNLSGEQFEQVKSKLFGYEGVLPLAPGKYKLEIILSNKLKKTSFKSIKDVVVPDPVASSLRISDVVTFTQAAAGDNELQPFQIANLKFTPGIGEGIALLPGQDLNILYQIWATKLDPKKYGDSRLSVEYAYGRMGLHDTKTIRDDIDPRQFDLSGSMVNGKKISTLDLQPGQYHLALTVTDPETHERAFGALSFRIVNNSPTQDASDIVDPELAGDMRNGTFEFNRSLAFFSQSNTRESTFWLQRAFARNPANQLVMGRLINICFAQQQFEQVAAAFSKAGVSEQTDDQTILRIAQSFDKLGQVAKSIEVLKSAISLKPQSGPLFLSLSEYYQKTGDSQKAQEMEQRGRSLLANRGQTGS
jgi:GWxTD domain-containing protein